jgi:6-methylsalicylate decarboxylase
MAQFTKVSGWMDIHAHFSPPTTEVERVEKWHAMHAAHFLVSSPYEWKVEETLSYMDRQGIAMQFLSNIPATLPALQASNDYGIEIMKRYPSRFRLLAALPTDNVKAAIEEVERMKEADGWAVTSCYNSVYLGDKRLDSLWEVLDKKKSVVFVHPNAYAPPPLTQAAPLVEVGFDTCRTVVDMLYKGVFRRYKGIRWVLAHCGGALPALSGRLLALGGEEWVANPMGVGLEEMTESLRRLYLDTAATAVPSLLLPALEMTGRRGERLVYGSDSGVPCTCERTLNANVKSLLAFEGLTEEEKEAIGHRLEKLFPAATERVSNGARSWSWDFKGADLAQGSRGFD